MVKNGDLIMFTKNEEYSKDYIIKQIGSSKLVDSIEKGYFIEISENKYKFTETGQNFAWKPKIRKRVLLWDTH